MRKIQKFLEKLRKPLVEIDKNKFSSDFSLSPDSPWYLFLLDFLLTGSEYYKNEKSKGTPINLIIKNLIFKPFKAISVILVYLIIGVLLGIPILLFIFYFITK
jgi:hypothetical protein